MGRFFITTRAIAFFAGLLSIVVPANLLAQQLKVHPTPFSIWLDFRALSAPNARPQSLPIWLEKFEHHPAIGADNRVARTTFRIRFRELGGLNDELLLRLYFDDQPEIQPVVTAWTELGMRVFGSEKVGRGLGLDTSESLLVPMAGVDYIEIVVPGTGSNVRGAFLSSVKAGHTRHALDFQPPEAVKDPFENVMPTAPDADDWYLFGRVKAVLEPGELKLAPHNNFGAALEFELQNQPLLALITFDVLASDLSTPPQIVVNNQPLGPASMNLPDLADPAYVGAVYSLERDMRFRYTGWIRCQKLVPGSSLRAGVNQLSIQAAKSLRPLAVRAVAIQLKYASDNLNYTITPR